MPFHVLLLPGHLSSRDQLDGAQDDPSSAERPTKKEEKKDFLVLRHEFQKKKASRRKNNNNGIGSIASSFSSSNADSNDNGSGSGGSGNINNDVGEQSLSSMASPLEIAMAKCCERPDDSYEDSQTTQHTHRSRFHRPICPSNYESASEPMASIDESEPPADFNAVKKGPKKAGVLLRGKEGHFAALIAMHCPAGAVGHRAMALAILQRTVAWEAANEAQLVNDGGDDAVKGDNIDNEGGSGSVKLEETSDGNNKSSSDLAVEANNTLDSANKVQNNDAAGSSSGSDEATTKNSKAAGKNYESTQLSNPNDENNINVKMEDTGENDTVNLKETKSSNEGTVEGGSMSANQDEIRSVPPVSSQPESVNAPASSNLKEEESDPSSNADVYTPEGRKVKSLRIKSFLAAGGMKILARWLVEASTPVPATSILSRKPTAQQKGFSSSKLDSVVAAPTGCLLLPLLHLLKSIPFDKEIVLAAQINKCIKRLKKALDAVLDSVELSDFDDAKKSMVAHPVAGGRSVSRVLQAVDRLMNTWKRAAAAAGDKPQSTIMGDLDPFQKIKNEIKSRFNELADFQSGEGGSPSWLPKSVLGILTSPVPGQPGKIINSTYLAILANSKASEDVNRKDPSTNPSTSKAEAEERIKKLEAELKASQKAVRAAKEKRTLEEILSKRRKDNQDVPDASKKRRIEVISTKKVCWTDRPNRNGVIPRPLTEERIFIKDPVDEDETAMEYGGPVPDQNDLHPGIQVKEEDVHNVFYDNNHLRP